MKVVRTQRLRKGIRSPKGRKLEERPGRQKAANRSKEDLLATLSHELRTPLNPVLLLASDGARNADFPPQARMDFDSIRKNIELEARLIDDMLDMTHITRGKLALENKPVDVHIALYDAVETVHSEMTQKKIELALNLNAREPVVTGDTVRLRQIFWNVLKNAVKFTPPGRQNLRGNSGDKRRRNCCNDYGYRNRDSAG
jgi:signal transduction histidine kinase